MVPVTHGPVGPSSSGEGGRAEISPLLGGIRGSQGCLGYCIMTFGGLLVLLCGPNVTLTFYGLFFPGFSFPEQLVCSRSRTLLSFSCNYPLSLLLLQLCSASVSLFVSIIEGAENTPSCSFLCRYEPPCPRQKVLLVSSSQGSAWFWGPQNHGVPRSLHL